ncbi:hypothetical protein CU100_07045 [Phyllobacterium endophyticum]|uniref:Uncharacterized protein n=1 Tax=Phyllobacterium endophyticum TaxID=1149773 RepID=A0A2P7B1T0_9HYPH|nr:hypothetical protein CU100_07045 [Phyllobacterium endophyticum]
MANSSYPEFECAKCTAVMVAVRRNLSDSSAIICSRCGNFLGTFADLDKRPAPECQRTEPWFSAEDRAP